MSIFCEFHKAWRARFPGHELPGAWEEDVRANLSKHRARAALLKEELEKEEFYVNYLERLLEDVQRHKIPSDFGLRAESNELPIESSSNEERGQGEGREASLIDKSITGLSVSESLINQAINTAVGQSIQRAVLGAPPDEEPNCILNSNSVKDLARKFTPDNSPTSTAPAFLRSTSVPNPSNVDEGQFVTVIPINGTLITENQKRVPPAPPPKTFKRPTSIGELRLDNHFPYQKNKIYGDRKGLYQVYPSIDKNVSETHSKLSKENINRIQAKPLPTPPLTTQSEGKSSCKLQSIPAPLSETSKSSLVGEGERCTDKTSYLLRPSSIKDDKEELNEDEPIYDTVAPDEEQVNYSTPLSEGSFNGSDTIHSATSSSDGVILGSDGSNSPALDFVRNSPKTTNYANADYFFKKRMKATRKFKRNGSIDEDDCEDTDEETTDEIPRLLRSFSSIIDEEIRDEPFDIDSGVYGSSVESTTHIPSASPTPPTTSNNSWCQEMSLQSLSSEASINGTHGKGSNDHLSPKKIRTYSQNEAERITMYKCIISSILESETIYLECLDVVLQYMKALKATLTTSQPVISPDDFSSVFYRIPELHNAHSVFLNGLRQRTKDWQANLNVGDIFKTLASKLDVYAQFLQNYQRAVDTVRRCSSQSQQFADITRSIKLRSLQGQAQSLEDLLHRPVARVQKNALVLHDLLKYTPETQSDHGAIKEALNLTQNFLTHLSMMQNEAMFPSQDRRQRHLVRNSFIVELVDGQRKLRHLFLFNDVIVCAKYKVTAKAEKFTFEVKWFISLHDIIVEEDNAFDSLLEHSPPNLVALKTQASTVRDQIKKEDNQSGDMKITNRMNLNRGEKRRKKLSELETQLILASPNLPLKIKKRNDVTHIFLLTSEYERDQWGETIRVLQANTPGVDGNSLTLADLQVWITTYRSFLKTNMGSLLFRSNRERSLLMGDLHIVVTSLHGLTSPSKIFLCFEVDSYGHFFRKAKTKTSEGIEPHWNQDFIVEMEGSQVMRILCYETTADGVTHLRGKAHLELSRSWLSCHLAEKRVSMQDLVLVLSLKFLPPEATLRGIPNGKPSGLFGVAVNQICRREKRSVPFVVTRCVREVERRGLNELGVYRVSGLASDISKLKKSFESNHYEAEQLIKEVDIHSVTGLLKLYLRELPEALFTDDLYQRFFEAFSSADSEYKKNTLLKLFSSLPQLNQSLIVYLLEHLVKINQHDSSNKMSLHNLATVFGPTLLRPAIKSKTPTADELLTASTINVMAQAGILHFFLKRRASGEPIQIV